MEAGAGLAFTSFSVYSINNVPLLDSDSISVFKTMREKLSSSDRPTMNVIFTASFLLIAVAALGTHSGEFIKISKSFHVIVNEVIEDALWTCILS